MFLHSVCILEKPHWKRKYANKFQLQSSATMVWKKIWLKCFTCSFQLRYSHQIWTFGICTWSLSQCFKGYKPKAMRDSIQKSFHLIGFWFLKKVDGGNICKSWNVKKRFSCFFFQVDDGVIVSGAFSSAFSAAFSGSAGGRRRGPAAPQRPGVRVLLYDEPSPGAGMQGALQ